jgi:hypothetical protein
MCKPTYSIEHTHTHSLSLSLSLMLTAECLYSQFCKDSAHYIVGKAMSLADVYLATCLSQLAMITFDLSPYPVLLAWWSHMRSTSSFSESHSAYYSRVAALHEQRRRHTASAATATVATLYYHPLSPPSRLVHYFAIASGIVLDLCIINLQQGEQRSSKYLQINPHGKVPALNDNGLCLYEVCNKLTLTRAVLRLCVCVCILSGIACTCTECSNHSLSCSQT